MLQSNSQTDKSFILEAMLDVSGHFSKDKRVRCVHKVCLQRMMDGGVKVNYAVR